MFKFFIVGLSALTVLCTLSAQDFPREQREVTERLQQFTEAMNRSDVDALSSFWTEEAVFIKPGTGSVIRGKKEITQFLQKVAKEFKDRSLKFSFFVGKIQFLDPENATVEGVSEISNTSGLLQRNARRVDFVKERGKWYIDEISEIEVAPPPPLYQNLKPLEWLLGKWKDKDENVNITFDTRLDKYKSFIIQRYNIEMYGLEAMEGQQIIGWDPIEKKLRSWAYDSDGGFGTGLWSFDGKQWEVVMNYVLSDGSKGVMTNIYRQVNDKSYTFASINRAVNGEKLPEIQPVTIVKEE